MPRKSYSDYHEGATLSEPTRVSIHSHCTLFPPNKHFYSLHYFVSMWKFISTQLTGQGLVTGHWSLVVLWLEFSVLTATA